MRDAKLPEGHISEWLGEDNWLSQIVSEQEANFLRLELSERSQADYEKRLDMIGFSGRKKVLDLACGVGQWSVVMGNKNAEVIGVDKHSTRLMIGREISAHNDQSNVTFKWGRMEDVPAEDGAFDAVFCFGAFMFGNGDAALKEIWRVTEPGALVYVNANGWGWYAHRFLKMVKGELPRRQILGVALMALSTIFGRRRNRIYTPSGLRKMFEAQGFEVISFAGEGRIGGSRPFYESEYHGMPGVFEILARSP